MSRILIVTDAWYPQTNGVVRCLDAVGRELRGRGHDVQYLTPDRFWTVPLPTYPEIRLSLTPFGAVAQQIAAMNPDHIHIATEGPLGLQAKLHCADTGLGFTTSYHTRFPEYVAARMPVPSEWSYAYLRWFHSEAAATLVPTRSVAADLEAQGFGNIRVWSRGVDASAFSPGPKTPTSRRRVLATSGSGRAGSMPRRFPPVPRPSSSTCPGRTCSMSAAWRSKRTSRRS